MGADSSHCRILHPRFPYLYPGASTTHLEQGRGAASGKCQGPCVNKRTVWQCSAGQRSEETGKHQGNETQELPTSLFLAQSAPTFWEAGYVCS